VTRRPFRVLCLDIEGGHGGSSRSLYQVLRHIDRSKVEPEVWCRRNGHIKNLYENLGIVCHIRPSLPKLSFTQTDWRASLHELRHAVPVYVREYKAITSLANDIKARFDLVHLNHPGFVLLGSLLKKRLQIPIVTHIRTQLPDTLFGRWQARLIEKTSDDLIYITENERSSLHRLGAKSEGHVVYNIAPEIPANLSPLTGIPRDKRLNVASLSNFAWVRGVDRLAEVAEVLMEQGQADRVRFVVAGDMKIRGKWTGPFSQFAGTDMKFADYIKDRGFSDMFVFPGHVNRPESVLYACDVLIKLTRESNPWGRDIIEAQAMGVPVVTLGTWQGFVKNHQTGIIQETYSAAKIAASLMQMADDRAYTRMLGENGKENIKQLCDGPDRATEILNVWRSAILNYQSPPEKIQGS
jgi:glycosyltransferase involved in cell wall biosynthesis